MRGLLAVTVLGLLASCGGCGEDNSLPPERVLLSGKLTLPEGLSAADYEAWDTATSPATA